MENKAATVFSRAIYMLTEEVGYVRFDGSLVMAQEIAADEGFKGSISYQDGRLREFSLFDEETKRYNEIRQGDFIMKADRPQGNGRIFSLSPGVFHCLFQMKAAHGVASSLASYSLVPRTLIVETANRIYREDHPNPDEITPNKFYEFIGGMYKEFSSCPRSVSFYDFCKGEFTKSGS